MPAEKTTKINENRRSNKPIMEKRRRARINSCLNDLKSLILEALKKDPARHSKLEKADILEMTVKHLQSLHRQQLALTTVGDPNVANKFRAGFNECATEVTRFLSRTEGLDVGIRERLVNHLLTCMSNRRVYDPSSHLNGSITTTTTTAPTATLQSVNMNTIMNNCSTGVGSAVISPRRIEERPTPLLSSPSGVGNSLQLYPTRLPNGDFALLLPGNYSLAPYVNTPQGNFLVNNGTRSDANAESSMAALSSPGCTSRNPVDAPMSSIPMNLQSPHTRFQDCRNGYGSSSRNVHSTSSFVGQVDLERHFNNRAVYSLEEKEVEENSQVFTTSEVSCRDSLMKKDPWRPW